jgi:hypothetical protein
VPQQDAQGRWVSDDGLQYWDGSAWRPLRAQAPARGRSAVPAIVIGCLFAFVVVIVLLIAGGIFIVNNADFQRGFCNGFTNGNPNATCPFHPTPS